MPAWCSSAGKPLNRANAPPARHTACPLKKRLRALFCCRYKNRSCLLYRTGGSGCFYRHLPINGLPPAAVDTLASPPKLACGASPSTTQRSPCFLPVDCRSLPSCPHRQHQQRTQCAAPVLVVITQRSALWSMELCVHPAAKKATENITEQRLSVRSSGMIVSLLCSSAIAILKFLGLPKHHSSACSRSLRRVKSFYTSDSRFLFIV